MKHYKLSWSFNLVCKCFTRKKLAYMFIGGFKLCDLSHATFPPLKAYCFSCRETGLVAGIVTKSRTCNRCTTGNVVRSTWFTLVGALSNCSKASSNFNVFVSEFFVGVGLTLLHNFALLETDWPFSPQRSLLEHCGGLSGNVASRANPLVDISVF